MKRVVITGAVALSLTLGACSSGGIEPAQPPSPAPGSTLAEDDPGWNCHTMGNHVCGHAQRRPVPAWLSCNTITDSAGYEFPAKAARAWRICYRNLNQPGSRGWQWVGRYDGQRGIWAAVGATTVYLRQGWFETS